MSSSELVDLEEQGWRSLSATPGEAAQFYDGVLDHTVVMLLPGGLVLDDRDAIIASLSGQPWASFEMQDLWVFQPTTDTGIVAYGVLAQREGAPEYSALISSHYVRRDDGWKLVFHQQTPR